MHGAISKQLQADAVLQSGVTKSTPMRIKTQ